MYVLSEAFKNLKIKAVLLFEKMIKKEFKVKGSKIDTVPFIF